MLDPGVAARLNSITDELRELESRLADVEPRCQRQPPHLQLDATPSKSLG